MWKKSLVWWTCCHLAKSEKSSRCTVLLTEETSLVDEVFASRRITSKPNYCFSRLCTSLIDEVSSVSDMFIWNSSLISPDGNMSTTKSDFFHALDLSCWLWRWVVLVPPAHSAQVDGWDLFLSPSSGTSSQSLQRANNQTYLMVELSPLLRRTYTQIPCFRSCRKRVVIILRDK